MFARIRKNLKASSPSAHTYSIRVPPVHFRTADVFLRVSRVGRITASSWGLPDFGAWIHNGASVETVVYLSYGVSVETIVFGVWIHNGVSVETVVYLSYDVIRRDRCVSRHQNLTSLPGNQEGRTADDRPSNELYPEGTVVLYSRTVQYWTVNAIRLRSLVLGRDASDDARHQ